MKKYKSDGGYDLGADLENTEGSIKDKNTGQLTFELKPGERAAINTGIAIELTKDTIGLVLSKSTPALKHGIIVLNAPGLIDPGYRGKIKVILHNTSKETFIIHEQTNIAQLVLINFLKTRLFKVPKLDYLFTDRSYTGMGFDPEENIPIKGSGPDEFDTQYEIDKIRNPFEVLDKDYYHEYE